MKIYHAQVNHLENPVGFRMERTVFSWNIKEAKGKQQSYARIRVSSDEAMEHLLFDSGEDTKASSLCYPVKLELEPRTRYYWTVEAGSDAGEKAVSEVQFLETGKREEAWSAKWVSCSSEEKRHPPKYPVNAPTRTPMVPPSSRVAKATKKVVPVPFKTRLKISRPK